MVDKLSSKIDKASASIAQITESVAELQAQLADIAKQQATMDEMRAEEKAAYVKAKKDYEDGVEGLTMALEILREYYSAEPALLQQPSVSTHSASGDAATGIIGILEVSQSDFSKLLADANVEEETAVKEYEKVSHENAVQKTMKEQDVKYQLKEKDQSTKQKAALTEALAQAQEDLAVAKKSLAEDTAYLGELKRDCQSRAGDFEAEVKDNKAELGALGKAKAILLKKFALVQTSITTKVRALSQVHDEEDPKARALRQIEQLGRRLKKTALVALAYRAAEDPFGKIRGMVEDMIAKLLQEAAEEATQKAF